MNKLDPRAERKRGDEDIGMPDASHLLRLLRRWSSPRALESNRVTPSLIHLWLGFLASFLGEGQIIHVSYRAAVIGGWINGRPDLAHLVCYFEQEMLARRYRFS